MVKLENLKIGDVVKIILNKNVIGEIIDAEIIGFRDSNIYPVIILVPNLYGIHGFSKFITDCIKNKIKKLQHSIRITNLEEIIEITNQKW